MEKNTFHKNYYLYEFPFVFFQHGESEFNVQKRLGGDSDLTVRGEEVGLFITAFMNDQSIIINMYNLCNCGDKIYGFSPLL